MVQGSAGLNLNTTDQNEVMVRRSVGKSLIIPIKFRGKAMRAVVETAAMVTVVNEKLFLTSEFEGCPDMKLRGLGTILFLGDW